MSQRTSAPDVSTPFEARQLIITGMRRIPVVYDTKLSGNARDTD